MNQTEIQSAGEKLTMLKSIFLVEIQTDWGDKEGGWQAGSWSKEELDRLHDTLMCFAECLGGAERFRDCTGQVNVLRQDLDKPGGEALAHQVKFALKQTFSAWTVVHEFAHAWDANKDWKLSRALETYTGGHTSRITGYLTRIVGTPDSGLFDQEDKPGLRGRKPGCNVVFGFHRASSSAIASRALRLPCAPLGVRREAISSKGAEVANEPGDCLAGRRSQ